VRIVDSPRTVLYLPRLIRTKPAFSGSDAQKLRINPMQKTTASLKPAEVEKKWIVVDAQNAVVGRLATFIAMRLRGKHRPDYTPHVDCGDFVVVINADKVKFTGKKLDDKVYYRHTGHPGGVKSTTPRKVLEGKFPERVLEKAVERMLPKESPLARKQLTHLLIYNNGEHPHQAQSPEVVDFAARNAKNTRSQ
jgi:large subunit ribosomal protein L13